MDGAKRARSGKPRIRPSVDLHHPRLLPTRLHATRCWLGGGAPRGHAAHATARRGAGDLQFREELRIPCPNDLFLDSVVVGAARAMAHVAIRPWSSRPVWSTKPSPKRRAMSRSASASRRLHNVRRLSRVLRMPDLGEKVVQLGSRAQRGGSESRGAIIFVRGVRCSWKREPTWRSSTNERVG